MTRIEPAFLLRLLAASALVGGVALLALRSSLAQPGVAVAAAIGYGVALANVLAGYAFAGAARRGDPRHFNMMLFGSMTVRVLAILAVLALCISVLGVHALGLVVSLFTFYLVFLAIELHALLRGSPRHRDA